MAVVERVRLEPDHGAVLMATLIIYLVVAVGAIAAIGTVIHAHDKSVLAPYQVFIDKCAKQSGIFSKTDAAACVKQWDDAVAFNVSLQADVAKNQQQTAECNAKVQALQDQTKDMQAARAKSEAANKGKIAAANERAQSLEQALAEKTKGVSCAKRVAKAGNVLLPIASDRVRDFAATAGTEANRGKTGAAVHPGPDSLRIGK